MKDRRKTAAPAAVETYTHQETRTNIPTEEMRPFVPDEGDGRAMLYPRDPSLDPQLVWKGKDEQDREDLAVPVVPIYIQEKVQPRAIIEQVRAAAKKPAYEPVSLFSDFNGLPFDELIDFYQHQQHWTNRMILGDSLLVMTSLAEKEALKGKVQMIYMDPPYGIKFGSNWQVSTRQRDVKDGKAEDLTRQPEQIKAFRDTWALGIHSYLTYLRDRLAVARDLLTESGSIFVQIGDGNVHLVRCILDEVFGSENFCALITFTKTGGQSDDQLASVSDFILWYAKDKALTKYRQLYFDKEQGGAGASKYNQIELEDGSRRPIGDVMQDDGSLPRGSRVFRKDTITSQRPPGSFPVEFQGQSYTPEPNYWKTGPEGFTRLGAANRLIPEGRRLAYVRYIDDFPAYQITNVWSDVGGIQSRTDPKIYVVQSASSIVQRCVLMTTDPGDLVLDPTCGSGTTAYVAEQWGRRWITCDTSRVALALARTRLMAARFPYYVLADSAEGAKKEAEITGQLAPAYNYSDDLRKGFVYKRVPHVTLKSIANNAEIDMIYARWQPQVDDARRELNKQLGRAWEEWQVPREEDPAWPAAAKIAYGEFWQRRRARQKEIDASIARHADTELLYDQPYEDGRRVRVTGPFTAESLSPHRVLAPEEERPEAEAQAQRDDTANQFVLMILDNLKKAGVQNTVAGQRLAFDRLEPVTGQWIQARGEYTDAGGSVRRVAVSVGPQYGTVGAEQVQQAAVEATRGIGCDVVIVCGFAFDAFAGEKAKELSPEARSQEGFIAEQRLSYGKVQVLLAKMNPDLSMGDALLKKTGAGNLFMVFGEPDVHIGKLADGRLSVHIRGVDIYDPTTGEIRSSSTDDIACWFIDTSYDGKSFFVRHAYFTGGDQPYEKLKRTLRAEIDEAAWSALYSAESIPFDAPATGKLAVKVINHYGDEVLKVYDVQPSV